MLINQVCKLTGLTKKAIEYYEKQCLLSPETTENGYRNYKDFEISVLKEISILRKMGIGIADIRNILKSKDKSSSLMEYKNKTTHQIDVLNLQRECIDYLIDNSYNIDDSFQYITKKLDENCVIKERLKEAFPGNYGLFLSFHFGRFLHEKIDTPEKEIAYGKILDFLDGLADIPFPKDIEDFMKNAQWNEDIAQNLDKGMRAEIDNFDDFMKEKKDIIEMYLKYCKSEEYKSSLGYKFKTLITDFQKKSGYIDVFIENIKILSSEYSDYLKKLNESNEIFLREYPNAAEILGYC